LLLLCFLRGFFHNAQASDASVALLVPCQCCRCDTQQALGFSGTDSKLLVPFFLVPSLFLVFSGFGFIFCSVWIASRVSYGALPYCDWL
jgi:hypothetical protein